MTEPKNLSPEEQREMLELLKAQERRAKDRRYEADEWFKYAGWSAAGAFFAFLASGLFLSCDGTPENNCVNTSMSDLLHWATWILAGLAVVLWIASRFRRPD